MSEETLEYWKSRADHWKREAQKLQDQLEALAKRPLSDNVIRALALSHGFKLKEQPHGITDLNPYVYEFARALANAKQVDFIPSDFLTHKGSWRKALEIAEQHGFVDRETGEDDPAYWRHELAAFDRAYTELEALR